MMRIQPTYVATAHTRVDIERLGSPIMKQHEETAGAGQRSLPARIEISWRRNPAPGPRLSSISEALLWSRKCGLHLTEQL